MNITSVDIFPSVKDRMRAFARITIDDEFVVKDIRIIQLDDRMLVAMPAKKDKDGKFQDLCHPITKTAREQIQDVVLDAYSKHMKTVGGSTGDQASQTSGRSVHTMREVPPGFRAGDLDHQVRGMY